MYPGLLFCRLETRANEGRINEEDLKLAGIGLLSKETLNIKEEGNYDSDDADSTLSQPCSDNTSIEDMDEWEFDAENEKDEIS